MAARPVPAEVFDALASDLAVPVATLFGRREDASPETAARDVRGEPTPEPQLADALPVWSITTDVAKSDEAGLASLARPARMWHHQVVVNGVHVAFARTRQVRGRPRFLALVPSPVAGRIDRALDWVDRNVPRDPPLRLLEAPPYRVTALWIAQRKRSRLLVVDAPPGLNLPDESMPVDEAEFLNRLRAAPVIGGRRRAGP